MTDIRYPEGPANLTDPSTATQTPTRGALQAQAGAQRGSRQPAGKVEDSAWQAAVVRVSTVLAIWLGY